MGPSANESGNQASFFLRGETTLRSLFSLSFFTFVQGLVTTIPLWIAGPKILDKAASSRFTDAGVLSRSYLVSDSRRCLLKLLDKQR